MRQGARVRMGTVKHARVEHSGQLEIQRIVDAAGHPLLRVYHADRLSNRHISFLFSIACDRVSLPPLYLPRDGGE